MISVIDDVTNDTAERYVTFTVGTELLGIHIDQAFEVLPSREITPVPLAPEAVLGFINLRGQIVTAIDLRAKLGIETRPVDHLTMFIIVRDHNEQFCLVADAIGDVREVPTDQVSAPPSTLERAWRACCDGVFAPPFGDVLILLDVARLLQLRSGAAPLLNVSGGT